MTRNGLRPFGDLESLGQGGKIGIVLPEKAVGQMVMQRIIKEYAEIGVTVKIFSDGRGYEREIQL
jgi:hypothetical protein